MKSAGLFCKLNMGWPSQNQHIRTNENVQNMLDLSIGLGLKGKKIAPLL